MCFCSVRRVYQGRMWGSNVLLNSYVSMIICPTICLFLVLFCLFKLKNKSHEAHRWKLVFRFQTFNISICQMGNASNNTTVFVISPAARVSVSYCDNDGWYGGFKLAFAFILLIVFNDCVWNWMSGQDTMQGFICRINQDHLIPLDY